MARTPAQLVAPTFTIINRLVAEQLTYTEELNRPGTASLGCPIGSLSSDVKTRLANLAFFPSEVWIYADSTLVWAGEIQTLGVQDQTLQLGCVGLLGYTYRMGITSDLTYSGIDQFTIAKGLVDHWQALDYGNYGLVTSGISTSGVTRDRTYLRNELHNIGQRLAELGAVNNGFDIHVEPSTRDLTLSYPTRGTDLSASVFLDRLNIDSVNVMMSVGPDDLISDISATGTGQDTTGLGSSLYSARSTSSVRTTYGRSWASQNFDGVSVQATLEGHADAYKDARTTQLLQPGVTLLSRLGTEPGSFHPGDTVAYSFDAGLGVQSGTYRVSKLTVTVDSDGRQRLGVEFV